MENSPGPETGVVFVPLPARTAFCGAFMRASQAQGRWVTGEYRPWDIVIYNFPGNNVLTDHCGIVITPLTDQEVLQLAERMQAVLAKRPISATLAAEVDEAVALGITDGSGPNKFCTRAQCAAMVKRAVNRT